LVLLPDGRETKIGAAEPERTKRTAQRPTDVAVNVKLAVGVDEGVNDMLLTPKVPQVEMGVTMSVLVAYGGGIDRTTETVTGAPIVAVAGTPLQPTVSSGRTTTLRVAGETV
jgi:hypothetical protein